MILHNKTKKIKSLSFLLTILIIFPLIVSCLNDTSNIVYANEGTAEYEGPQKLNMAQIGEDPWWNASYQWRQCINITNPGSYNLIDNFVSIEFDYGTLRDNYNMDADLYDVRIVENGEVRNYYVKKDFPTNDIATIWFETNSSAGESEYDTYMYWGNASINYRGGTYINYDPSGSSWWSFEEGSGGYNSETIDSLNNCNATLYGTSGTEYPTYDSDSAIGDYSLYFDGTNEWAYINDDLHFTEPNEITSVTVSCWFKTDFSSTQDYTYNWAFFDFDRSEFFNFYIDCDSDANGGTTEGRIGFSSSASGSSINDFYGSVTGLNNDEWHFACVVYDGSDKYIYVDDYAADIWANPHGGRGIGTGTDRWGFFGDGSEATSENGGRNSRYYEGYLDEVRYFDYAVAPDEIEWLAHYYAIETDLLPVTERAAAVTIIIKDVDGRRVPGAEVSLWKNATDILEVDGTTYTDFTLSDGTVSFTKVPFGFYNITVNYTISSGEAIVYDSRTEPDGEVEFKGLMYTTILYTDLWTIDFEVDDWDGNPLNYGYINVSAGTSEVLESLTLDSTGKATFRWLNRSSYNYTVYYDNIDYVLANPTALNSSIITRESIKTTYFVNNTNVDTPGTPTYSVNVDTYLEGSSYGNPGNITAIDAMVELDKMDNLTQVRIWYLDDSGHQFKELKDYTGQASNDTFVYHPDEEEDYDVFGLRLEIEGANKTKCNGIIEVSLSFAYSEYIRTNMSKLSIQVIDNTATVPVEGVTVRAEINGTGEHVVDLKTDDQGYAYGIINDNLNFWYKRETTYNFSLWIITQRFNFKINYSDQWFNEIPLYNYYNYTLYGESLLVFELNLNFKDYITRFQNGSLVADTEVAWGENMTFAINFEYSDNAGGLWNPDDNGGTTITLNIKSTAIGNPTVFEDSMQFEGSGTFSITLNSSEFSAGDYGKSYFITISGKKLYYYEPPDVTFSIFINSLPTSMSLYNYSSMPDEIPSNTLSQYYNELINMTIRYYDTSTSSSLTAESVTYNWDYGSGSINPDPMNPGYYTFELNTALAPIVGIYKIDITATLENHTKIDDFEVTLNILLRPTEINGTNNVIFLSENVYALETELFEFNYTDVLTGGKISNPDEMSYNWQKLDEYGVPIPGENKIGNLIETGDHSYILDLDTEKMELGDYFVFITLDKLNYELRSAVLSLTIEDRPTSVNGSTGTFVINMGDSLNLTYSYIDDISSTSITNLDTQSYIYNSTEITDPSGGGSLGYDSGKQIYYLLGFDTASKLNATYTITITFDKENYTSQVVVVTLIINYALSDYHTYLTLISKNPTNFTTGIYWRDNVTISFNFTKQYQSNPKELAQPTTLFLQFRDESLNGIGNPINMLLYNISSVGEYSYTFNSSEFSFIGGESYYISIYGSLTTPPHTPPTPLLIFFKVQSILTDLTIHNYTTGAEFPSYTLTEYWNRTLGITFYFSEAISNSPISNALVTYNWAFGSGIINPDVSKGVGYYSFFFDTGNVTEVGAYTINILAVKQNFTNGVPSPNLVINIINRPTLLNSNDNVLYLSQKLYARDSYNFTFEFIDSLTMKIIKDADEKSFILVKLDENGVPINESTLTGILRETTDHQYILDLNTKNLQVGEYSIVVTLNKDNYDFRVAIISLTINKREFSVQYSIGALINLVSGATIQFQITLTDPNNSSVPIVGADLTFAIRGHIYSTSNNYIIDNGDGTYTVNTFPIAQPFLMPETFLATLSIEKANFTSETKDFTVVVQIEEIFPGMPTFYFILIVGAIAAVGGSLVSYRLIQQRRIPTFVKKARSMKKDIKGSKSISESLLYPTKDEYIVKKLGDKWDTIGLSLLDVMGIPAKKKKLPSIKEEKPKKLPKIEEEKPPEPKLEPEPESKPEPEPEPEKEDDFPEDEDINESYGGEP
ncbi:MAG: LamG-like jellyroll fold domain-containing protein [Promethearchaeota archaeon]